jgi:hypothetical protein
MSQQPVHRGLGRRIGDFVHEGNVRHVVVEKEGKRAADLPLTIVVIVGLLAVWAVAILAAIAILSGYTITIENTEAPESSSPAGPLAEAPVQTPEAPAGAEAAHEAPIAGEGTEAAPAEPGAP